MGWLHKLDNIIISYCKDVNHANKQNIKIQIIFNNFAFFFLFSSIFSYCVTLNLKQLKHTIKENLIMPKKIIKNVVTVV